jgi:pimeloyl-ACP methyl ester carboxylesterase
VRYLRASVYRPTARALRGAYLIAPGLHYAGPDDPRMDRFLRVLASAGYLVYAPYLPSYLALDVRPPAFDELSLALDGLRALPEAADLPPPTIFSISFGSVLALGLAARRPADIARLVLFGPYASWEATVRFVLTGRLGEHTVTRDPLNQPVVFMNYARWLPPSLDRDALLRQWRRYIEATWGRPEMKVRSAHEPIARALGAELPAPEEAVFLCACGIDGDAMALADELAEHAGDHFRFLDPAPLADAVRCPVTLCHGRDDDVIPYLHSLELAERLRAHVPTEVLVTGLYGHTGGTGLPDLLRRGPALARELRTMLRIVAALAP